MRRFAGRAKASGSPCERSRGWLSPGGRWGQDPPPSDPAQGSAARAHGQRPVRLRPPPLVSPRSPFCHAPPWGSPRSQPLALPLSTPVARLCCGRLGPLPVPTPRSLPKLEGRYLSVRTPPGRGTTTRLFGSPGTRIPFPHKERHLRGPHAKEISHPCALKPDVPGSCRGFGKPDVGWAAAARGDSVDIARLRVAVVFRTVP